MRRVSNSLLIAAMALSLLPAAARADGGRIGKVSDPAAAKECGACHMAYQPGFLPQRSWREIMSNLPDHFGEDASLDEATRQKIEDYLLANAADAGRARTGGNDEPAILRISDLPWFRREHGARTRARAESNAQIGSMSNCVACHRGAESGLFDDD